MNKRTFVAVATSLAMLSGAMLSGGVLAATNPASTGAGTARAVPVPIPSPNDAAVGAAIPATTTTPVTPAAPAVATPASATGPANLVGAQAAVEPDQAGQVKPVKVYWFLSGR